MLTLIIHFLLNVQLSGWELLASVDVVQSFDEFMGTEIENPRFPDVLLDREGTRVTLEGFVIPLRQEEKQDFFILSRFPYQSCFFCGVAGPETVIEVYSEKRFPFTDERVRVKGTLRLNKDNPLHLFYILEDCEVSKTHSSD